MKDALIDPNTQVYAITGWTVNTNPQIPGKYVAVYTLIDNSARVAEVVALGNEFEVASPLFWTECADDVVADQWYYDTVTTQILAVPEPAPRPVTNGLQQP